MVTVSVVRSSASTLTGELAGKALEMMLDSGSAVSLLIKGEADIMKDTLISTSIPQVRLIMASGEPLPVVGCVKAPIRIDQLAVSHQFLVVERLVTPAASFKSKHTMHHYSGYRHSEWKDYCVDGRWPFRSILLQ